MQKRIKSILPFTWRGRNGATSTQPQPQNSECLTGKLYDSISTLTLERFIKVVCDGDLSQLFIKESDYILTKELISVWESIHEAFLDGMKDKEGLYKLRLMGKINHLQFSYEFIQLCVKYLSVSRDQDVIDLLQRHVRVGDFNPEDMAGYRQDCQVVLNRAQGLLVEIENKKAELSVLNGPDNRPAEKTTRKQFDQLIAQVSIYAKFHIDKRVIVVSEFIEYYIARRESIEAMEEQYKKK